MLTSLQRLKQNKQNKWLSWRTGGGKSCVTLSPSPRIMAKSGGDEPPSPMNPMGLLSLPDEAARPWNLLEGSVSLAGELNGTKRRVLRVEADFVTCTQ